MLDLRLHLWRSAWYPRVSAAGAPGLLGAERGVVCCRGGDAGSGLWGKGAVGAFRDGEVFEWGGRWCGEFGHADVVSLCCLGLPVGWAEGANEVG